MVTTDVEKLQQSYIVQWEKIDVHVVNMENNLLISLGPSNFTPRCITPPKKN